MKDKSYLIDIRIFLLMTIGLLAKLAIYCFRDREAIYGTEDLYFRSSFQGADVSGVFAVFIPGYSDRSISV